MKYVKSVIFIMLIVFVGLLSSCTSKNKDVTFSSPYVGGDNGLILSFQPNNPPDEIYDNGLRPFNIVLKIKNDGEYLLKRNNIYIKATGFSPSDFGTTASALMVTSLDTDLQPKSKSQDGTVRPGGETYVTLPRTGSLAYKNSVAGTGEITLPIGVDVCYLYMTRATTLLCVTEDLLRPSSDDVCKVNAEKQVYNSGSPVKVTKVVESATKNKIRFEFEITFNGKGRLIKPNRNSFSAENCKASEYDFDKIDTVYVRVDPNNKWGSVRCTSLRNTKNGEVKLFDYNGIKKAIVTCEVPITGALKGNYVKPLDIQIYYQYKERLNKQITIKHVETS